MQYDKRANLRVSSETWEAYEEVAGLLGISVSALMRQALEQGVPTMQALGEMLRRAKSGDKAGVQALYARFIASGAAQLEMYRELGSTIGEDSAPAEASASADRQSDTVR